MGDSWASDTGQAEYLVLGGDTPTTDDQRAVWPLVAQGLAEGLAGQEDYAIPDDLSHQRRIVLGRFMAGIPADFNMTQT
jgi:hypothetical protein